MKKFLFDLNHPAHFHLFKNIIYSLIKRGHHVKITAKNKDVLLDLLETYSHPYEILEKRPRGDGVFAIATNVIKRDYRLYHIVRKYKPHILLGTSISITHVGKLLNIPSLYFGEDGPDVVPLARKYAYPFATYLITPDTVKMSKYHFKHITYNGYHELVYLHPNYFNPDKSVFSDLSLEKETNYFIIRISALKAHHDVGIEGVIQKTLKKIIKLLNCYGKVFITSEIGKELSNNANIISITPNRMHHVLFYARLYIGDSQTMTAEAAVLGTPSIRCNSFVGRIGYLEELEHKYGLTYGFLPSQENEIIEKIKELLEKKDLKKEWGRRREKMINDKIDVTAFMIWFIENYPESAKIMKENPDYQNRFKSRKLKYI
ncbi:MAG: DUF354 domain-containing protein [Methanosarcinales archaeon]